MSSLRDARESMIIRVKAYRAVLDYRYRGTRYLPVLGHNLSPDQEREAVLRVITAINANLGSLGPSGLSGFPSFVEFAPRYIAYLQAKKLTALDRPITIIKICISFPILAWCQLMITIGAWPGLLDSATGCWGCGRHLGA